MKIDMERITCELGDAYARHKEAEVAFAGEKKDKKNRKTGVKERFLDAATEAVAQEALALKSVVLMAATLDAAEHEARRRNPRWLVQSSAESVVPGRYIIVLEEDPFFKPYTYVNHTTKLVWSKQVVDGSPYLDDEKLKQEDIGLYYNVTRMINKDFIKEVMYESGVDPHDIDVNLARLAALYPQHERALIPFEELDGDTLAAVQEYIYPGKPTVKLAPPRKAKSEDLDEDDDES